MSYISEINKIKTDERILKLRSAALEREIPVTDDETLCFLLTLLTALKPRRILEIGTAVGLSAAAMLFALPKARLVTVEIDEERYTEAKRNLSELSLSERCVCHLGDAGEIINMMDEDSFDFIFLDGPKAQYVNYLFDLKRVLRRGGVIFADDVLLFGWVDGSSQMPYKRHSIVAKIKEYLEKVTSDADLSTSVIPVGDGVAFSVKL